MCWLSFALTINKKHTWIWSPAFGVLTFSRASLVVQRVKNLPVMQETEVWFLGWEDNLEEEMATHSSTLAWKIPWTEEPGGLQSMMLQRVGHDRPRARARTHTHTHTHTHSNSLVFSILAPPLNPNQASSFTDICDHSSWLTITGYLVVTVESIFYFYFLSVPRKFLKHTSWTPSVVHRENSAKEKPTALPARCLLISMQKRAFVFSDGGLTSAIGCQL